MKHLKLLDKDVERTDELIKFFSGELILQPVHSLTRKFELTRIISGLKKHREMLLMLVLSYEHNLQVKDHEN